MSLYEVLKNSTTELIISGISSSRLDTLMLLEFVLMKDRAWMLSHEDYELSEFEVLEFEALLVRRSAREPLAYIRKSVEFYGHDFLVTPDVLIPRPESESFLELTKDLELPAGSMAVDVGTGSGALGISFALAHPPVSVELRDISPKALIIAKENISSLKVKNVLAKEADLLQNLPKNTRLILANLPYVPNGLKMEKELDYEPALALFGGVDGLDVYRKFFTQLNNLTIEPTCVLTESLMSQHHPLAVLARNSGYILEKSDGLVQLFIHSE